MPVTNAAMQAYSNTSSRSLISMVLSPRGSGEYHNREVLFWFHGLGLLHRSKSGHSMSAWGSIATPLRPSEGRATPQLRLPSCHAPLPAHPYPHYAVGQSSARAASGHGRAAEQRHELAPPHSITSSARASSVGGTSRPIV